MVESKRQTVLISILFPIIISIFFLPHSFAEAFPSIIVDNTASYDYNSTFIEINTQNFPLSSIDLTVKSNESVYKYFGLTSKRIDLALSKEGDYELTLSNKNNILDKKSINVKKNAQSNVFQSKNSILTDKNIYSFNDEVKIVSNVSGTDISAIILSKDTTFKYVGIPQNFSFFPHTTGLYEIRLVKNNEVLFKSEFLVVDSIDRIDGKANSPTVLINSNINEILTLQNTNLTNQTESQNQSVVVVKEFFRVHNSKGEIKFSGLQKEKSDDTKEDISTLEISSNNIKRIRFRNLSTKNALIGVDEVSANSIDLQQKKVVSAFAIDPSNLNFTDATVTATARGTELYKCADWSFLTQTCFGTWNKLMDLTPGENYNFTINSTDPGFAETGVSTINTRKPIYHPGESVEIMSAVIDSSGYLVTNANVTITVISPNNQTYYLSNSEIGGGVYELSRGIYQAFFNSAFVEGDYTIKVDATSFNVNFSLVSTFKVKSFYEFDILRDTPMSIDPWHGAFTSTINISQFINATNITLTETLPINLTVVDSGGAIVTDNGVSQQLTWNNISTDGVFSYTLQAPLITPNLFSLGQASLTYQTYNDSTIKIFFEARPWYVAVDPLILINNTVCDGSQNNGAWTWGDACDGGSPTTQLNLEDGVVDTKTANNNNYAGTETGYTLALNKCISISNVSVCLDWWYATVLQTCVGARVSNAGNGGPWTAISGVTCPAANGAAVCYNVTSLKTWTCDNFNNGQAYIQTNMRAGVGGITVSEDLVIFNVTFVQDLFPPIFSNSVRSQNIIYANDTIMFNITMQDNQSNVSFWFFSWNASGAWANKTNGSATGLSYNASTLINISYPLRTNICYLWFANDSVNNQNQSSQTCFTVEQRPTFYNNITNFTIPLMNSLGRFNISVNASLGLSSWIFGWNASGSWQNISNGTINNLTNYNISLTKLLNYTWGTNICYAWYANDSLNAWGNSVNYCFNMAQFPHINFYNNITNFTSPNRFNLVRFNITANSSMQLSSWIFSWNASGSWQNVSNNSISGTNVNLSTTLLVNANWGDRVCYVWYANDSYNDWDNSSLTCFNMGQRPLFNFYAYSVNNSAPKFNTSVMFNITANSSALLSFWIFGWNISGSYANVSNGSMSTNTFNISLVKNVTAPKNSNVCYSWYGNTTYNDWNQSLTYCFNVSNSPPTQTIPILNSSLLGNTTSENLICYNQSTNDVDAADTNLTNVYNWYRNGTPYMVLNMPFDINITTTGARAIKDFSGYGNNGTISALSSIVWEDQGKIGGAYTFTAAAVNEIVVLDSPTLDSGLTKLTIEAWIYPTTTDGTRRGIVSKRSTGGGAQSSYAFTIRNTDLTFYVNADGAMNTPNPVTTNAWHHVVAVWDPTYPANTQKRIYVDGVGVVNGSNADSVITGTTLDVYIGAYHAGGPAQQFYGTIDNVKMYNDSLTPQQIYENYIEGLANISGNTIVSQELFLNDTWTCQITPADYVDYGLTINSTNLTIKPTPSLTVNLMTPVNNTVQSTSSVNFIFNVSSNAAVTSCDLILNSSIVNSTSNITLSTPITLSYNPVNKSGYIWSVNCSIGGLRNLSEQRNLFINLNNSVPVVNLTYPSNNQNITGSNVTLNCSVTDDGDIETIQLYTDRLGPWQSDPGAAVIYLTGFRQTSYNASFTLSGLTGGFNWNCFATDYDNLQSFASSNYYVNIIVNNPNVTLTSPTDFNYDLDGNINFICNARDVEDIANVTLYTNAFGSWAAYSTTTYAGVADTNVNPVFNIPNINYSTSVTWNCLAYDSSSTPIFGLSNYTVTIPARGKAYYADYYSYGTSTSAWSSPYMATAPIDGAYSNALIDLDLNIYTYNFTGMPNRGSLLSSNYLTVNYQARALGGGNPASGNDLVRLSYSTDYTKTTWLDLSGAAYGAPFDTMTNPYSASAVNQSYQILGPLTMATIQNLSLRMWGFQSGTADNNVIQLDSLFLTMQYTPPPWYTLISVNKTPIYQNDRINLSVLWNHEIKLGCYNFSLDQGSGYVNTANTCINAKNYNATSNWTISAAAGTLVKWYSMMNDSFNENNQTDVQYFYVTSAADIVTPTINSVTVTPVQAPSRTSFNITADITDNIGTAQAIAELTLSNTSKINYSMIQKSANIWTYFFPSTIGGDHSVKVYAIDGGGNTVSSSNVNFNVTAYILPFREYYGRGDTVNVQGLGFSQNASVTFRLNEPNGSMLSSSSVTSDMDGNVSTTWSIPSSLDTKLGNYTISLNDTVYTYLRDVKPAFVIKRIDETILTGSGGYTGGSSVASQVLDSDNVTIDMQGRNTGQTQDFNITFENTMNLGYNMTGLILYIKHIDGNPPGLNNTIFLWNGSSYQAVACNPILFSAIWKTDACDLTSNLSMIPNKNKINLRINYTTPSDQRMNTVTVYDFIGAYANWSGSNLLAVRIDSPSYLLTNYNFSDSVNNKAYFGETANLFSAAIETGPVLTGTEATALGYTNLTSSDDIRWQTTTNGNTYTYQSFYFTIQNNLRDITRIYFNYEGHITRTGATTANLAFRIYAFNYTAGNYVLISDSPIGAGGGEDIVPDTNIPSNYTYYINSTSNTMSFLVVTQTQRGNAPWTREDVYTDLASLDVYTVPTISGFQNINATALDTDGVKGCQYHFANSTFNFSYYQMSATTLITYFNLSNTTLYPDGYYNLTVNCSANVSDNASDSITVKILNAVPGLTLMSPVNQTNFTVSNANLVWMANSSSGIPLCDLYVDNVLNQTDVVSLSGQNISSSRNFSDGTHTWKVSCHLTGVPLYNSSETRTIYVDSIPPSVTLNTPSPAQYLSSGNITFFYTPTDVFGI